MRDMLITLLTSIPETAGENREIVAEDMEKAIKKVVDATNNTEQEELRKAYVRGDRGAALALLMYNIHDHAPHLTPDTIGGVLIAGDWEGIRGVVPLDMGYYTASIPWDDNTGSVACKLINRAREMEDENLAGHARFALQAWVEWKTGWVDGDI